MKYQKFIAVFDNHGDMQDTKAVNAALEFKKHWKPNITIHGGDCFDLRPLRKSASEEEQRERLAPDIETGIDFLKKLQPTHFLRGNHDERLYDLAQKDDHRLAELADHIIQQVEKPLKNTKVYPYCKRNGVLKLGNLTIIHGYHNGLGAAKQAAQIYGNVLMGHTHVIDHITIPTATGPAHGKVCGCLCQLDMTYNRAQANTLRQTHGFAYGLLFQNGQHITWQAQPINNQWHFPSEITTITPQ